MDVVLVANEADRSNEKWEFLRKLDIEKPVTMSIGPTYWEC